MQSHLILLFAVFATARGHTLVAKFNDIDTCVRPSGVPTQENAPLHTSDFANPNFKCNLGGNSPKPACPVTAGDEVSATYILYIGMQGVIDPSHKGPCIVYMAKKDGTLIGGFFKIYQDGFSDGEWCTLKVRRNVGKLTFRIPKSIPDGEYVVRTEMIALHEANRPNGAQFFVTCIDVAVSGGTNTLLPSNLLNFGESPSPYSPTDPGLQFDVYASRTDFSDYLVPGGTIYNADTSMQTPMHSTQSASPISGQPMIGQAFSNSSISKPRLPGLLSLEQAVKGPEVVEPLRRQKFNNGSTPAPRDAGLQVSGHNFTYGTLPTSNSEHKAAGRLVIGEALPEFAAHNTQSVPLVYKTSVAKQTAPAGSGSRRCNARGKRRRS